MRNLFRPLPLTLLSWAACLLFAGCGPAQSTVTNSSDEVAPSTSTARSQPVDVTEQQPAEAAASVPPEKVSRAIAVSQKTSTDALLRAKSSGIAMVRPPRETLSYSEILDENTAVDTSLSLGTIRDGKLENALSLPIEGSHHQIIERHRSRNTNYGTAELIGAIERAAAAVHEEHGGAPLRIGNISRRRGGAIPWSTSHEAGRDADIAFYALDEQGNSVPTPDLIAFDDQGEAQEYDLYFDVPRNWTLVRALITDDEINIHWLFVSEGIKTLLLKHALEIGEPDEIFERASKILHQPTDAPPHDDHLHLRVGCSKADRLRGCIDWGPQWEWYDWHDAELFARTREIRRAFDDPSPELRHRALEYLQQIRAPHAPEIALIYGLVDDHRDIRELAVEILEDQPLKSDAGVHVLARHLEDREVSDDFAPILYDTLRRSQSSDATDVALQRYLDEELPDRERAMALEALAHRIEPRLIPIFVRALGQESSPNLRVLLARQLRRIAARTEGLDWSRDPLTEQHEQALRDWEHWWETVDADRRAMLSDLLARHGVEKWRDLESVDRLIALLRSGEDFERYNINLILSEWTGRWVPREWENRDDAYRFWTRWWNRNRERLLDDTPRIWEQ